MIVHINRLESKVVGIIALALGLLVAPLAADAQRPKRVYRIG